MVVEKQILNTIYLKQRKDFDDKLMLVIKNNKTKEKEVKVINDPKFYWYVTKPEHWLEKPVIEIELDKVNKRVSNYRNLLKDMSIELGKEGREYFSKCIKSRNFDALNKLHIEEPNFHGTDMNIEDQYISRFVNKYGMPDGKLTKAFFDIEVDISPSSGWDSGFPDEHRAEAPINAVTIFYDEFNSCKTYLLRNPNNTQVEELENNPENLMKRLHDYFKEHFNSEHNFEIFYYDEEIHLIQDFLDDMHELKPDFATAYNMKFDFLTIKNRIMNLGYNPEEFFCHPDFPYKYLYYYEDKRQGIDIDSRGDYAKVSGYTVFKDAMLDFAAIRKTSKKEDSYKLNDICQKYLGVGKYQFPKGVTIANIPDIDFESFVFYNIIDVMLVYYLEKKNEDIDLLYSLSMLTESRINKALTKTVCLRNYTDKVYKNDLGLVLSNNRNQIDDSVPKEKFRGALTYKRTLNPFNCWKAC